MQFHLLELEHTGTSPSSWCSCSPLPPDRWRCEGGQCVLGWGGWVGCPCLIPNGPQHNHHILHTTILTPEGDVASSTHIRGSWVGLSEDHWTFTRPLDGKQLDRYGCHQQFYIKFKQSTVIYTSAITYCSWKCPTQHHSQESEGLHIAVAHWVLSPVCCE